MANNSMALDSKGSFESWEKTKRVSMQRTFVWKQRNANSLPFV
jgi:hypothetical protein